MRETGLDESSPGKLNTELLAIIITIPIVASALTQYHGNFLADDDWGPRMLVTSDSLNTYNSWKPHVAGDIYGNFYVVWENDGDLDNDGIDSDIYLRKWSASTQTWGPRVLVNDDDVNQTEYSALPEVVTDIFGNVHCIWYEDNPGIPSGIDYIWRMWNATENEWGKRRIVAHIEGSSNQHRGIAADKLGNVHVVWPDRGAQSPGIQYRKWNGTSQSWEDLMTVSANSTKAHHPDIAVDSSGDVHVVWQDRFNYNEMVESDSEDDIFYRKLDTYTKSWGPVAQVNDDDMDDEHGSKHPRIAVDMEGDLHVVWREMYDQAGMGSGRDVDVFYRRWSAPNHIWETRRLITDEPGNTKNAGHINVAVDPQGNLHIVWDDQSDVDNCGGDVKPDVFYKQWNSGKDTWENITCLTQDLMGQRHASPSDVASDGFGNIAVVWTDNSDMLGSGTNDLDVYMRIKEASYESLGAEVDCHPDTLNLKSEGNWVTCYIELEFGLDPKLIDPNTILLNDFLAPELDPKFGFANSEDSYIVDHDGDSVLERLVKFNRSEVQELVDPGFPVPFWITGQLYDGTEFRGTDENRVIDPNRLDEPMPLEAPRETSSLDNVLAEYPDRPTVTYRDRLDFY